MTERATTSLTPSATILAPEGAARPKVMRRPAHFAGSAPETSNVVPMAVMRVEPLIPETTPALIPAVTHSWQDDGRFGIALIALLLLINSTAILWLSTKPQITPAASITITQKSEVTETNASPVTVMTDEDMLEPSPFIHVLDSKAQRIRNE